MSEFTLENGLHFIVLERHTSPVVSCHTYADVGAFDEPAGQTGAAPERHLRHCVFQYLQAASAVRNVWCKSPKC